MNNEVLRTVMVIIIAITSVILVGFYITNLVVSRLRISCTSEQLWAASPLVGAGAIILICQNLLYLDIRICYAVILIWMCVGLAGVISVIKSQFSLSGIPWKLIATGFAIYVVHAAGLIYSGVSNYYGYGWVDMYNYVSTAQYFIDYPFSSTLNNQEYIRTAHYYMHDRIGQSVLHAFIASSSGADAQQSFGATILLSPMLIYFSLFLLSVSLGIERRFAYPAAIIASLSPAIASVHLECFFSQALAMPFIFLWPLAVSRLQSHPGVHSSVMAGLLIAVTSAIYTEVIPIMILIALLVLLYSYWDIGRKCAIASQKDLARPLWKVLYTSLHSLGLSLMFATIANIGYLDGTLTVMSRTTAAGVLDSIYPWAFRFEGLWRLWIGHQSILSSVGLSIIFVSLSLLIIYCAIQYFILLGRKKTISPLYFSVLVAAIPLAPLLLSVLLKDKYPYQYYKLLLIVWPLILFFGSCGISELLSRKLPMRWVIYFQLAFISLNLTLTSQITFASSNPETVAQGGRGGAHLLIDKNFKQMRQLIDRLEGKRVYLWWYDKAMYNGNWRGRWLAYHARKNIVWSMNPTPPSGAGVGNLEHFPYNSTKIPVVGISWNDIPLKSKEKIGSNLAGTDPFYVYQLTDFNELLRIDHASRECGVSTRSMRIKVDKSINSNTWYPLWVAGRSGAATFFTVNFSKSQIRFRYDQWGYPVTIIKFDNIHIGKELLLNVRVDPIKQKIIINCNGVLAEGVIANVSTYLKNDGPLGINNVTDLLEGKYQLASCFPGKIAENASPYNLVK